MAKLTQALVLCAVAAHGIKPDQLLEADAALIKALAADGSVDPNKDAVAAAKARGAEVVRSIVEQAAEARAAAVATIQAELAQLADSAAKPDLDAAARQAIAERQAALQAELAALEA